MANMLWTRPVSENGAQCLGMGEQMFMTLRDQGDPTSSQTHWSKRWTASFERIDISQLVKCTNKVRKCLVQLCTNLSPNICNTAKFMHVGPDGLLVRGGNKLTGVMVQVPQCPRWLCGEVGEGVWKTCIFCFFPIINKYLCMAKHSLLSEQPLYYNAL